MARAYTFRLVHLARSGGFDVVVYVAPPGRQIVIRDIVLTASPASEIVQIYVLSPGGSLVPLLYRTAATDPYTHLELRQALSEGDEVHVASTAASTQVMVTGYDLDLM